jgi:hypothetical protein
MSKLGVMFKRKQRSICADSLFAARALTKGLEELKPLMIKRGQKPIGK